MKHIPMSVWDQAFTYAAYRDLLDSLLAEGKTTGNNHAPDMLEYARMNIVRMNRLDKTVKITDEVRRSLGAYARPLRWLTITEGWCGDAAQIVPVIDQLAAVAPAIEHRLILRDEHLDVMDAFLTNGGRAIPVTIVLDASTHEVLAHWGPRPAGAQAIMNEAKPRMLAAETQEERDHIFHEAKTDLQKWYAADKGRSIQENMMAILAGLQVAAQV
jgi:hypothetical protein